MMETVDGVMAGVGRSVSVAVPALAESAALVAVMVTVCWVAAAAAGAV